jgi:hypothetical protein
MRLTTFFAVLAAITTQISAHLVLTYPGSRGNNLHDTGRLPDGSIPDDGLGVRYNNATHDLEYPYGMQWIYPCMPTPTNYVCFAY